MQGDLNKQQTSANHNYRLGLKLIYLLAHTRMLFHRRPDGSLLLKDMWKHRVKWPS
jgi:hypothetical protein